MKPVVDVHVARAAHHKISSPSAAACGIGPGSNPSNQAVFMAAEVLYCTAGAYYSDATMV